MCAQDSIVIIWLSTVDFETDAVGVMVREQCPAHCPFTLFLAFNVTLLPLTFCAGWSYLEVGGISSRPTSETDKHFIGSSALAR